MKYSPREFMKMRRPEKFSDSVIKKKATLNRTILEYKLDAITSNNQELDFQNFCVKLAQLEIAPNLRLQTGPTGGGDSKADSETYSISDFTRLNLWEGLANESGDRWAIAISANKKWVEKVVKDVKGIVETKRDYKRIFFITNQFAKDKKRAEMEDKLGKEYSIPITILDRTWILDRVFRNEREKLAIDELKLGDGLEEELAIGPNDAQRKVQFDSLNQEIENALSEAIININVVNKALNAARLGRSLELPRQEVEGLFDRAIKLAEKLKLPEQVYSVKYEKAWASFFWFEDFEGFLKLVGELETIAEHSDNIHTIERQTNLGSPLRVLQAEAQFSKDTIQNHIHKIKAGLNRFAADETRPSASHQAKILLAFENLFDDAVDKRDINIRFKEIGQLLQVADGLLGFPYEEVLHIIRENGDVFGGIPEYENLINIIVEIDTKRKGEVPAAKSLLDFGMQQLKQGHPAKAIEYIGRALVPLYKKESKDDFIQGLYFISFAYEELGLLWAARGSLIHAASYATNDLKQRQQISRLQVKCCRRLKMLELRLGRVGYILNWHQTEVVLAEHLATSQEELDKVYKESLGDFSALLGCLLLKTRAEDLPKLEKAPTIFNRLAMDFSGLALLYLLGGEKYLPEDFWQTIGSQSSLEFFSKWANQPASQQLLKHPAYYVDKNVTIESDILGTHYVFQCSNSSPGVEICEMLVAALEGYLSTAINMEMFGKLSEYKIIIEEKADIDAPIVLPEQEINGRSLKVFYKEFNPHHLSVEVQKEITTAVSNIVIRILAETIAIPNENALKELIVKQEVGSRAFNFLSPLVMLGNVLGHNPKRSIAQWINEEDPEFPFDGDSSRSAALFTAPKATGTEDSGEEEDDEDPPDLFSVMGHQHIKTESVINELLWHGEVWRGFAFAVDPSLHSIQSPTLYFMFEDKKKAVEIFKEWRERFGEKAGEKIKISILKGISAKNPYWYKGLITSNIVKEEMKKGNQLILMTKISTMTPANPRNLEGFLESFSRFGYFTIAPLYVDMTTGKPEPLPEPGFTCKSLIVKNAWEVGLHDLEMTAIAPEDDPIIPNDEKAAPVVEVLKMKRAKKGSAV